MCLVSITTQEYPHGLVWSLKQSRERNILVIWRITMLWMQNKLGKWAVYVQFLCPLRFSKVRDIQSSQAEFQQGMQHQCCGKIPGYGNAAVLGCSSSCGPRGSGSCSY